MGSWTRALGDISAVHRRCGERQVLLNADVQRLLFEAHGPDEIVEDSHPPFDKQTGSVESHAIHFVPAPGPPRVARVVELFYKLGSDPAIDENTRASDVGGAWPGKESDGLCDLPGLTVPRYGEARKN